MRRREIEGGWEIAEEVKREREKREGAERCCVAFVVIWRRNREKVREVFHT